jgi:3-oxoadipate enol-lactonase
LKRSTTAWPTLVIGADDDVLAPVAVTRAVADAIPGARYELLAGTGHMMNLEVPDAFNALLRDFLANSAIQDWT